MTFGQYLKEARLNKNKTQIEFAKRIGIGQDYLSLLENDKVKPGIQTMGKIAKELEVEVKFLRSLLNENH